MVCHTDGSMDYLVPCRPSSLCCNQTPFPPSPARPLGAALPLCLIFRFRFRDCGCKDGSCGRVRGWGLGWGFCFKGSSTSSRRREVGPVGTGAEGMLSGSVASLSKTRSVAQLDCSRGTGGLTGRDSDKDDLMITAMSSCRLRNRVYQLWPRASGAPVPFRSASMDSAMRSSSVIRIGPHSASWMTCRQRVSSSSFVSRCWAVWACLRLVVPSSRRLRVDLGTPYSLAAARWLVTRPERIASTAFLS